MRLGRNFIRSYASSAHKGFSITKEIDDVGHFEIDDSVKNATLVKIAASDIDGIPRGKYVRGDKFKSILKNGLGFCNVIFGWDMHDLCYDNTTFTGWHSGYPDVHASLDPRTYRKLPWEDNIPFFIMDFNNSDGSALGICPRKLLRRVVKATEKMGYIAKVGPEFEFFNYLETPHSIHGKKHASPVPMTPGMHGYSILRTGQNKEFMHAIFTELEAFGIPLEGFHTETGPGVLEAAIQFSDALSAADNAFLFKVAMKLIGHRFGIAPTFMAKVAPNLPGCSGHLHISLHEPKDGKNLFYDAKDPLKLSKVFRSFLAGQLKYMPDLAVMFCPNVNSYKRLVEGYWAPIKPTWGIDNRTVSLRVLEAGPKATRVEHRLPGSDCNPYIAMSAAIASGLHGVANNLTLDQEPFSGSVRVNEAKAEERLPRNLGEAVERFHASKDARQMFGEEFVEHYSATRRWEWRQYQKAVTDWETQRYFELA